MKASLLFIVLFGLVCGIICTEEEIPEEITSISEVTPILYVEPEAFDEKLQDYFSSHNFSLVVFYSSLCPFSRSFLPFLEYIKQSFPNLGILALDGRFTEGSKVAHDYGVISFPTIIVFKNKTDTASMFKGKRTFENLVEFIGKKTGWTPIPVDPPLYEEPVMTEYPIYHWLCIGFTCFAAVWYGFQWFRSFQSRKQNVKRD